MGVITIKEIRNQSPFFAVVRNLERPTDTANGRGDLQPGDWREIDVWIPWCTNATEFATRRIDITVDGRRFSLWQENVNGSDLVRVSSDGMYHRPGTPVLGVAAVSAAGDERVLIVNKWGPWMDPRLPWWGAISQFIVDAIGSGAKTLVTTPLKIAASAPDRAVPSVPKRTAVAFSAAGVPSDALDRGQADARFRYADSGKRYAFTLRPDGVLVARHPNGRETVLTAAISYQNRRRGEKVALPVLDLIAASGGRVLAKERGVDRFYLTTLDEMFVHVRDDGREFAAPSSFFKLDPETNQFAAPTQDLTAHTFGDFASHPATERFPLFETALKLGLMEFMLVRLRRCTWHRLDFRPPVNMNPLIAMAHGVASRAYPGAATAAAGFLEQFTGQDMPAPPGVPVYDHVWYTPPAGGPGLVRRSIHYDQVLDIGLGHVHHHQQYERVTGGELQPIRTRSGFFPWEQYAELYRFFNGPVRDADGYIDGTCNIYALVRLATGQFALLYADEQTFFTQRWRLVGPDDHKGLIFAVAADLQRNPGPGGRYDWNRNKFWNPFADGRVGPRSRLAVAAQVVLVSGEDAAGVPEIYSINFSWATIDRTWRWRRLPGAPRYLDDQTVARGDEVITAASVETSYPQTIRLREDMTLHVKGTGRGSDGSMVIGRWHQRYLPANNRLVPSVYDARYIEGQRPPVPYEHPWHFLPEAAFQSADQFSHFGVHAGVDSRTQYYRVTLAPGTDLGLLTSAPERPWIDIDNRLCIQSWQFPWLGDPHLEPRCPPSLFNRDRTRLRLLERGAFGWIALHWDKRDDDLLPFDGLPVSDLRLTNGVAEIRLTLLSNHWIEEPPVVTSVRLAWTTAAADTLSITVVSPQATRDLDDTRKPWLAGNPSALFEENVWRIRIAAIENASVISLIDRIVPSSFSPLGNNTYELRWAPPASTLTALRRFATSPAVRQFATSIWFEDIVGHVNVPEMVVWLPALRTPVDPPSSPTGRPVQITVGAFDWDTGTPVAGRVKIAGVDVGAANTPFTYTFTSTSTSATVSVPGYPDATARIPLYTPVMRVWVDTPRLVAGQAGTLTVRAVDAITGAAIAGRVVINGQDVAPSNTPFTYTFGPNPPPAVVTATGYAPAAIAWPAIVAPRLEVSISPYPAALTTGRSYVVRAVDGYTGAAVAGRVFVNGIDVAATNTPFTYTFRVRRVGVYPNIEIISPIAAVRAAGYPDADLDLGL